MKKKRKKENTWCSWWWTKAKTTNNIKENTCPYIIEGRRVSLHISVLTWSFCYFYSMLSVSILVALWSLCSSCFKGHSNLNFICVCVIYGYWHTSYFWISLSTSFTFSFVWEGVGEGCCTSCMVDMEAFSLMCDLKFVSSYS